MIRTALNRGETTHSEIGSPEATTYEYRIDKKTGRKISVPNGVTNLYNKIQAHLEQSKIENIVKRARGGDISALEKMNGQYIDISDAPTSMLEANDLMLRVRQEFETLPVETKRLFEFDSNRYIAEYGTGEWLDKMNFKGESTEFLKQGAKASVEEVAPTTTEEVVDNAVE